MNPLIQLKKATLPFLGVFVFVCLTLSPRVQAVVPPPDGGYPNFTTAEGTKALQNLTSGAGNTGVGWYSLFSVTDAGFNTGVGAGTLVLNTGEENTAVGTAALLLNTATGNTKQFDILANNKVGIIVSPPNSGVINGSTGGAGMGSTDPFVNISH